MKTEQPLLVFEDVHGISRDLEQLNQITKKLIPLKAIFETLNNGKLTNLIFQAIHLDDGQTQCKKYLSDVRAELENAGVKNEVSLQSTLQAHQPLVIDFRNQITALFESINKTYLPFLTYNENKDFYFVSPESKEKIIEKNRRYLTDDKEIVLHKALESLVKEINAVRPLIDAVIDLPLGKFAGTLDTITSFLITEQITGKVQLKDSGIFKLKTAKKVRTVAL